MLNATLGPRAMRQGSKSSPGSKVAERQRGYSRRQGQPYFAGVYDIAGVGLVIIPFSSLHLPVTLDINKIIV